MSKIEYVDFVVEQLSEREAFQKGVGFNKKVLKELLLEYDKPEGEEFTVEEISETILKMQDTLLQNAMINLVKEGKIKMSLNEEGEIVYSIAENN